MWKREAAQEPHDLAILIGGLETFLEHRIARAAGRTLQSALALPTALMRRGFRDNCPYTLFACWQLVVSHEVARRVPRIRPGKALDASNRGAILGPPPIEASSIEWGKFPTRSKSALKAHCSKNNTSTPRL
jgi:hypothetical protein